MFNVGKNVTYRGVVKDYRWQNPHGHIVVTVGAGAADPSTVGTWTVEASAINIMTSKGWTPNTYKPPHALEQRLSRWSLQLCNESTRVCSG